MRIPIDPRLPQVDDVPALRQRLNDLFRDIAQQLNAVSEGALQAASNAQTSTPTQGTYRVGDFVKNSTPSELGTAGNKYILTGWICTVAGSPGTWREARVLTGN